MTSCETLLQRQLGPQFRIEKMIAIDNDSVTGVGVASAYRSNTNTSKIKRRCVKIQSAVSLNNSYVKSIQTVNTATRQQVLTSFSLWMTLLTQFVMIRHSVQVTNGFLFYIPIHKNTKGFKINSCNQQQQHKSMRLNLSSDDWSTFQAMDDDDDEIVYGKQLDKLSYATENDSPEDKAAVGTLRSAPIIERDADPISVPAGTFLPHFLPH